MLPKLTLIPLPTVYATKQTNLGMTNKLNLLAVEKYSKSFATKVCENFFGTNETINGNQMRNLTNFQQINLLIIRALYERWQAETQRLRSPYFDFGNAEVLDGLKSFMNILSQHISVKRESFEPLLAKATQETLWLMLEPHKFFSEAFRDLPNFRLTSEEITRLSRYIQINKNLTPPLIEKLGGREFVFANQAIEWLDDITSRTSLEDPEKYLKILSETLPVPTEILPKKEEEVIISQPMKKNDSFFDSLIFQNDYETKPKQETSLYESLVVPPKVEVKEEIIQPISKEEPVYFYQETPRQEIPKQEIPKVEVKESFREEFREEPRYVYQESIKQEVPKVEVREEPKVIAEISRPVVKEAENLRVNERFGGEQKRLNDNHAAGNGATVLDLHKNRKIEDITHAISLNQRFLFINNLFGGSVDAYTHAIEELRSCRNFPEAKEVLLKKYVPKYLWDITSAEAEEFIDIVKRRFN